MVRPSSDSTEGVLRGRRTFSTPSSGIPAPVGLALELDTTTEEHSYHPVPNDPWHQHHPEPHPLPHLDSVCSAFAHPHTTLLPSHTMHRSFTSTAAVAAGGVGRDVGVGGGAGVSHPAVADPTPLGLAGFSSVILLVCLYSAGALSVMEWIVPAGLIAGVTLLFGSYFHFQNGHTFPATTFGFYGAFWLSIALTLLQSERRAEDFDRVITYIRIPVAVFTAYAWVGSLFVSKASFVLFTTLECKLLCFIVGNLCNAPGVTTAGACFGFVCCSAGYYTSASLLLKPFVIIPLGKPLCTPAAGRISPLPVLKAPPSKKLSETEMDHSGVHLMSSP